MFFLSKFLPLFALPLGVVVLLLLFALWRKKRWPVGVALVLLYVSSIPFVGNRLIGFLESSYPAIPVAQAGPADAVVVLGGIVGPHTEPGYLPNWDEAVERFEGGVALLQAGRVEHLVFTGARIPWQGRDTTEGADLRLLAIARGIAPEKIIVTREIKNTATEAAAVAELMQAQGWHRIILVTSGWHMPRAARLFHRAGVDFIAFPVDFRRDPTRPFTLLELIPNAGALGNTETALRECYGYAFSVLTLR
jgi:uncharacterized SAM-binding protein YcdF (DUF218 family)